MPGCEVLLQLDRGLGELVPDPQTAESFMAGHGSFLSVRSFDITGARGRPAAQSSLAENTVLTVLSAVFNQAPRQSGSRYGTTRRAQKGT